MEKPDAVREEYDRLAPIYDRRWRPYIDSTLRATMAEMRLDGQESVLDVACGTGELERLLLARWPELSITGADVSPGMLEQAKAKDIGGKVAWMQADAASLALPSQSFDYVICANSFHYFTRPMEALQEMRRVLRPRGKLVLVDWCDDYMICKLCSLWLRWSDSAFHRTYSLDACQTLLEEGGFRPLDVSRFRSGWVWGLMRFVCAGSVAGRKENSSFV
jgi:ubiquinone/menaquinone biosynthesis C-methylase UbiE